MREKACGQEGKKKGRARKNDPRRRGVETPNGKRKLGDADHIRQTNDTGGKSRLKT